MGKEGGRGRRQRKGRGERAASKGDRPRCRLCEARWGEVGASEGRGITLDGWTLGRVPFFLSRESIWVCVCVEGGQESQDPLPPPHLVPPRGSSPGSGNGEVLTLPGDRR